MLRQRTLEITTNIGCAIQCTYCPQATLIQRYKVRSAPPKRERIMSLERFRRCLETVPASVDIHFSGFAEPWHAPECTEMARHAHASGHRIAVFTTADRLSRADMALLAEIPFKRFVVHLPDQFGEMKLAPTSEYLDIVENLASSGIANLEYLTLGVPHRAAVKRLGRHASSRRIQERAGNVTGKSRTVGAAFSAQEIEARNQAKTLVCRADRMYSNVVLPNGDVQFCAMDYGLDHRIGNLLKQSYAEICNGASFKNIFERLSMIDSDIICRRCEYAVPGQYALPA